jgi:hypothetical protein
MLKKLKVEKATKKKCKFSYFFFKVKRVRVKNVIKKGFLIYIKWNGFRDRRYER